MKRGYLFLVVFLSVISFSNVTFSIPIVSFDASPDSGEPPLNVSFIGSAYDPDGYSIVLYELDFQGDGTFDFSSPTSFNATYTYITSGVFEALARATNSEGISGTATALIYVGHVPEPATMLLLGIGLVGLAGISRKKFKK